MHNGNGGFAVPTPGLPNGPQGTAHMDSAQVAEAQAYSANQGGGLMWLVALGLGYFLVTRRV